MAPAIITLLTDFGLQDAYVGIMKGVILELNPEARLVDLSHAVPPQDVLGGALVLRSAWRHFPAGTIHLAVVDPGVGSSRRGLAAACGDHLFVGPDNGIFSLVFAEHPPRRLVSLENRRYFRPRISPTFHGQDIFAPVAAHLSLGAPLNSMGPPLPDPIRLDLPGPRFGETAVEGQIIYQDWFGNLFSTIPFASLRTWLAGRSARVQLQERIIHGLSDTYSQVAPGALLALGGSHGFLEIACRQGSAAQVLGVAPGHQVPVLVLPEPG